MKNMYEIIITGDDDRIGMVELSDEEVATFKKILANLKATGMYAPCVYITNMTEKFRRRVGDTAEIQTQEEERAKALESEQPHQGRYTIGSKYPDLKEMLFK